MFIIIIVTIILIIIINIIIIIITMIITIIVIMITIIIIIILIITIIIIILVIINIIITIIIIITLKGARDYLKIARRLEKERRNDEFLVQKMIETDADLVMAIADYMPLGIVRIAYVRHFRTASVVSPPVLIVFTLCLTLLFLSCKSVLN
jgi:hypothetical protein